MSHLKVYWPNDDRCESRPLIRLAVFDDELENDEPQIVSFASFRRASNGRVVANQSATRTLDRTMRDN